MAARRFIRLPGSSLPERNLADLRADTLGQSGSAAIARKSVFVADRRSENY
jgi:hypothetical protein